MKIGVFDSGLGGLFIFKELIKNLPEYGYVYLGDVKRLPYGNRSDETIFEFTKQAVEYLFDRKDCALVILACNTASARALRRVQQEVLPVKYPGKRVLGVIIPTAEIATGKKMEKIGVLATKATVNSGTYKREILKLDPSAKVYEAAAPSLVTLIENNEVEFIEPILKKYLKPLLVKKIEALILGCTHYPIIKKLVRKIIGKKIKIVSQEEIIPKKLENYLERHPEIESKIGKGGDREILVTEVTEGFEKTAKKWLGREVELKAIVL